ncbi:ABC transporter permease [Calidifontibacillus erzurumensis]|uniref:FtsX-like permease family protein n=1 Tax=Calidifontibacillus erzurumensis TaxID=2741433 RepID=A0A8J8GEL5_9BACI|nr:FtsX-like permease family protein [Calidifontibacillus erzurumensis]NSL52459.1 FtsX-like permease family protein [Calidifontibacillus erzurumensis]
MSWLQLVFVGLKKRRKHTAILLTGTILGVLMITVVLASYQGMKESVKENLERYGEVYILSNENKTEQISYRGVPLFINSNVQSEKLSKDEFVSIKEKSNNHFIGISPRAVQAVVNQDDNKTYALVGIDLEEEKKLKPWWKVWGSWPNAEKEILIGYDIAQKYNLYEGDTLNLSLNGSEETFVVSGYLHYTGHIDDQLMFTSINHPFFANGIDFVEAALPYQAVMKEEHVPLGWSWSKVESTIDEKAEIISEIAKITPYIFIAVTLLGTAVIFVTLLSQTEERRNEFSLWRAIGFNRAMISKILVMETVAIAIIGSLIGIMIGIALANIFNGMMSEFEFFAIISWNQILIIISATIIVSILTAIYPISLALKQDPLKLLKING